MLNDEEKAIVALAADLGERIARTDRLRRLKEAEEKVDASEELKNLRVELTKQLKTTQEKEAKTQPVEPEEKKNLRELQEKLAADPVMRDFMKAQADYVELMKEVSDAVNRATHALSRYGRTAQALWRGPRPD